MNTSSADVTTGKQFLKERQIVWFSESIALLENCCGNNQLVVKNAKAIYEIAQSVVISHSKESMYKCADFLNVYASLSKSAFQLIRRPHYKGSINAVQKIIPKAVTDLTAMIVKRQNLEKKS